MDKRKQQSSWRETVRANLRGLKIFYERYPQMVLSRLLHTAWTALSPYVTIYLSALVVEELAGSRDPQRLQVLVLLTLGSAALIALVSALLNKWKEVQNAGVLFKVEGILWQKILDMDYVDLDETQTAELLSNIRQNQFSGGWGLSRVIQCCETLCASLLTVLGGISLTVSLFASRVPESAGRYTILNHPAVLLLVIALMLALTYFAPVLSNKANSYWARNVDSQNFSNRILGFFGLLGYHRELGTDVRVYRQHVLCEKYNRDKSYNNFSSAGIFAQLSWGPIGLYHAASSAVSVVFTGVAYGFVCLKSWAGAFGLGAVTQYVAAITKVAGGLSKLVATLGDMRNNVPFLQQVFQFLDIPNTMYQGSLTVEKRCDRNYQVEFRDVSFRYPGSEQYALRHVNMKFTIGSRLAVVGKNGSGKTTFIKLLCRLYDPTEGEILLNGINIRKYNYREYQDLFSVVFQDFHLFALPLGQTVAGRTDYDRRLVEECLQKAGFGDRLATMPKGLDTCLYQDYDSDGINVSGGEAQKIAIARALYRDAPFIILDEPTAALDPMAEAEIYSKFNDIVTDKTALYISHRLSSCRFCDEILVFEQGAVVQQGTHEELLAEEGGMYHQLWQAQAQYYTE